MGIMIDESITELEKARDSIEPCLFLDEAVDQSMKVAIEVMRKYQKIEQIVDAYITDNPREPMYDTEDYMQSIKEVLKESEDKE